MKKYLYVAVIILAIYILCSNRGSEVLDYCYADIDMDNKLEKIVITHSKRHKFGDKFCILKKDDTYGEWDKIYENDFSKIKPWKVEIGDVDGDNILEIAIGVYKTTVYDNKERKRLFIFNYDYKTNILVKKWTGSRLSNNLVDFSFKDIFFSKGQELITVEKNNQHNTIRNSYYWFGFGFRLIEEAN
jgi:hypothetical protein